MAISVTFELDISPSLAAQIQPHLDRILEIWLDEMGDLWIANMARVMPYNSQPSMRGRPPYSKTGHLARSLRKTVRGRTLTIHAAPYGRWLSVNLDRDFVLRGWRRTAGQSQAVFNRAVRRVLG